MRLIRQYHASRNRTLKTADRERLIMMLQTPDWNPARRVAEYLPDVSMAIETIKKGVLNERGFMIQFLGFESRMTQSENPQKTKLLGIFYYVFKLC